MGFLKTFLLVSGCFISLGIHAAENVAAEVPTAEVPTAEAPTLENVEGEGSDADLETARESLRHFIAGGGKREEYVELEAEIWADMDPIDRAAFLHKNGEYALAERTYIQVLEAPEHSDEKRLAVLQELAEVYADQDRLASSVYCLKTCLQNYPELVERPVILFRLAELYQEMGLSEDAIGMYYRVLNSVVITGEEHLKAYLGLARRAQFEIARTYYDDEAYERAYSLFDRIELLDINPEDRETVFYYKAVSALKSGGIEQATDLFSAFLETYPHSEFAPEILYLKADALFQLSRPDASADALLALLEMTTDNDPEHANLWKFWKQQAGNKLANRFYMEEKFAEALRLYQGMVALDSSPAWRLPIIYQIGLCFEQLSLYSRAKDSYDYIISTLEEIEEPELVGTLSHLATSVRWRLGMVSWRDNLDLGDSQFATSQSTDQQNGDSES